MKHVIGYSKGGTDTMFHNFSLFFFFFQGKIKYASPFVVVKLGIIAAKIYSWINYINYEENITFEICFPSVIAFGNSAIYIYL
jgi:hypothetical protein